MPTVDAAGTEPLACATVDTSTVGAVNFFGSTLGDLTVGLKATSQ